MRVTEYSIPADKARVIAVVSDLHEREPSEVLELLRAMQPDCICVPGDTLERNVGADKRDGVWLRSLHDVLIAVDGLFGDKTPHSNEYAMRFLRKAADIAPVFLSLGNHERGLTQDDREQFKAYHITLLDNADCCFDGIHIGGLSPKPNLTWLEAFSQYDGYKLLLCHHPEPYEKYLADKKINLILSGHAHDGKIQIGGKGIFAPGQGLFPKYYHGVYHKRLIVSAGCANTASIPRWGNPCEIIKITMYRDEMSEGQNVSS